MKKVLSFLLVLITSISFLVACANEPEPQSSPGYASEATSEQPSAPTSEPAPEPSPEPTPEPMPTPPLEIVSRIIQGETQGLLFGEFTWRVLAVEDNKALLLTRDSCL